MTCDQLCHKIRDVEFSNTECVLNVNRNVVKNVPTRDVD